MGLLDGKTGLVFGIANKRSYAWHITQALVEHGATCAFTTIPGEKNIERTQDAIAALDIQQPWVEPCDASQDEQLDDVFTKYSRDFDRLDFIVHSIAFADREWLAPGKFIETPREAFKMAVDISAYTLVAMAKRARPLMKDSGGGSILAMSYYGSEKVVAGYNVMGVAKATLECSTRYLASDLGVDGIRVNTISGGPLKTLAASAISGFRDMLKMTEERAPLRRNVEGAEVGKTAVFLVSDLSSAVTGENIYVDCGINKIGV